MDRHIDALTRYESMHTHAYDACCYGHAYLPLPPPGPMMLLTFDSDEDTSGSDGFMGFKLRSTTTRHDETRTSCAQPRHEGIVTHTNRIPPAM